MLYKLIIFINAKKKNIYIYIYIDNTFVYFSLIYYIDYNIIIKVDEHVKLKLPKISLHTLGTIVTPLV